MPYSKLLLAGEALPLHSKAKPEGTCLYITPMIHLSESEDEEVKMLVVFMFYSKLYTLGYFIMDFSAFLFNYYYLRASLLIYGH